MTRAENEQELVLGNKQLLSAFFVVVALLGVFFTAGYIVGRNAGATASKDSTKDSSKDASKDASANASPAPETTRTIAPEPAAPPTAQSATRDELPPTDTKPPRVEERTPAESPGEAVAVQSVPGHQYLQVMAVKRPEADKMVALLRKRGLPALIGESSKPELFRVLVGPFSDTPSLAKTKTTLKDLGFESVVSK